MSTEKTLFDKKKELLDKYWMGKYDVYAASDMILRVMDEWADIKVGEFISNQNSFTETTVVPKYILDEYAKKECISFMEAYQYGQIKFEKEPEAVEELYELYLQSKGKVV